MLGFKEEKKGKKKKEKREGKEEKKKKGVKHQELLNHLEIKPSCGQPISITPLKNCNRKAQKNLEVLLMEAEIRKMKTESIQ